MTKIHIRLGEIEVEYEGEADFLSSGLATLLEQLHELSAKVSKERGSAKSHAEPKPPEGRVLKLTTRAIATRLEAKSGTELALAASAYLHFVDGKATFTRAEILDAMKTATGIYTKNMRSNLSNSIATLITDKKLNEIAENTYALSHETEANLKAKLGLT